jgi:hypothetical protein
MPVGDDISDEVRRNRNGQILINKRAIEDGDRPDKKININRNEIEVAVTADIQTAETAPGGRGGLLSGHPNGNAHGSGVGRSGVERGEFSTAASTGGSVDETWLRTGRRAVRDATSGTTGQVREQAIGTDTNSITLDDTSLTDENRQPVLRRTKTASDKSEFVSRWSVADHDGHVEEIALAAGGSDYSSDVQGNILSRGLESISLGVKKELRLVTEIDISAEGAGLTKITTDGIASINDVLRKENATIGFEEIALGQDGSAAARSDTSLGNESDRRVVDRETPNDNTRLTTGFYDNEFKGDTIQELGVFTNQGNLFYRAVLRQFTKDDFRVLCGVGFRFR